MVQRIRDLMTAALSEQLMLEDQSTSEMRAARYMDGYSAGIP